MDERLFNVQTLNSSASNLSMYELKVNPDENGFSCAVAQIVECKK